MNKTTINGRSRGPKESGNGGIFSNDINALGHTDRSDRALKMQQTDKRRVAKFVTGGGTSVVEVGGSGGGRR